MSNMVANVFKILGCSIIFMFLLDMTFLAVDTINVNSKVTTIAGTMQNEIARNNCMPTTLKWLFEGQLNTIVEQSDVATEVKTNMDSVIHTDKNGTFRSISQDTPGEYGELVPLVIEVNMSPWRIAMGKAASSIQKVTTGMDYKLTYVYYVPCLRYLK